MNKTILLLMALQHVVLQPQRGGCCLRQLVERIRASISPKYLSRFDHMLVYERMAVVSALSQSGSCGSCREHLPFKKASLVRRRTDQVHRCPICGCFLYAPPADWAPLALEHPWLVTLSKQSGMPHAV